MRARREEARVQQFAKGRGQNSPPVGYGRAHHGLNFIYEAFEQRAKCGANDKERKHCNRNAVGKVRGQLPDR